MPKDERRIAGSVRAKGKVITDADELQKAVSQEELKSLTERGVISGFIKEKKEKE